MSNSALTYFEASRSEINERIKLRDQILLSFIVASGVFIGIGLKNETPTIMLMIPYLALGTNVLVSTHSIVIMNLGRYIRNELMPAINKCRGSDTNKEGITPWDASKIYKEQGSSSASRRCIAHLFIFVIPSLFSLYHGFKNKELFINANASKDVVVLYADMQSILLVSGLFFTLACVWITCRTYQKRAKNTEEL